jgi:hypothetical protein
MSDERKDRHPLDSDFPGEERLSRLYREGNGDLPPANLDAVILDAARQAVQSRPRRVYFFPSRKWVVPLSLAAALWVTLEVVKMQRTEITNLRLNAPSSFVLQPKSTEPPAKQALQARDRKQDALEARTARGLAPLPPSFRMQAVQPATSQEPREKRETVEEETDTAADATGLQAGAASEQPAQAMSDEQEKPARESAVPTRAPALLSDAPSAAGTVTMEARKEQALSPKEWIARIKELRRAGKTAEAEASLKAFKERYPEYPAEKILELAR